MIKYKNIYYMLAYAFSLLNEDENKYASSEEFEDAQNLFAVVLANSIMSQVKRGFTKGYVSVSEQTQMPHGKILFTETINDNTLINKRVVCENDLFDMDIYPNQIIKFTINLLLHSDSVSKENKRGLRMVLPYFDQVHMINGPAVDWKHIRINNNDHHFKMILYICEMILKGMLMTEESGQYKLKSLIDGKEMHALYQNFVLAYYKKHHPELKPSATQVSWDIKNESDADGASTLLPQMNTDIVLTREQYKLIIDTKYYSNALQHNSRFGTVTLRNDHIYQIFTYVSNEDKKHDSTVGGMLLYAKTDEEEAPKFGQIIGSNWIFARTVDLNKDFSEIKNQLENVLECFDRIERDAKTYTQLSI